MQKITLQSITDLLGCYRKVKLDHFTVSLLSLGLTLCVPFCNPFCRLQVYGDGWIWLR